MAGLGWCPCSRLHISMCVGVSVWLGWGGIRVAGFIFRCVLEFRCGWVGVVSV